MNKRNQMNKEKNRNSGETETIEAEGNENINKLYPQREIFIHERMNCYFYFKRSIKNRRELLI